MMEEGIATTYCGLKYNLHTECKQLVLQYQYDIHSYLINVVYQCEVD